MTNFSQTQLSNFATFAGLLVLAAQQFGFVLEANKVTFILAALWTVGWNIYNFIQRYKKGDLNVLGNRI